MLKIPMMRNPRLVPGLALSGALYLDTGAVNHFLGFGFHSSESRLGIGPMIDEDTGQPVEMSITK
jgi:hypothetical protein